MLLKKSRIAIVLTLRGQLGKKSEKASIFWTLSPSGSLRINETNISYLGYKLHLHPSLWGPLTTTGLYMRSFKLVTAFYYVLAKLVSTSSRVLMNLHLCYEVCTALSSLYSFFLLLLLCVYVCVWRSPGAISSLSQSNLCT